VRERARAQERPLEEERRRRGGGEEEEEEERKGREGKGREVCQSVCQFVCQFLLKTLCSDTFYLNPLHS
jgi:hypothetical protein